MSAKAAIGRLLARLARRCPAAAPPALASTAPSAAGLEFSLHLMAAETTATTATMTSADGAPVVATSTTHDGCWALQLAKDCALTTPDLLIGREHVLHLRAAAGGADSSTLRCELLTGAAVEPLAIVELDARPRQIVLSLGECTKAPARVRVTTIAGTAVVLQLQVAAAHRLGRLNALSDYQQRARNEGAHFSGAAYTHSMYGASGGAAGRGVVREVVAADSVANDTFAAALERRANAVLAALPPRPGEVTFNYALRALGALLPIEPPNFLARADRVAPGKQSLRMLSLCSGARASRSRFSRTRLGPSI